MYILNPSSPREGRLFMEGRKERGKEKDKEIKVVLILATLWKLLFSKH